MAEYYKVLTKTDISASGMGNDETGDIDKSGSMVDIFFNHPMIICDINITSMLIFNCPANYPIGCQFRVKVRSYNPNDNIIAFVNSEGSEKPVIALDEITEWTIPHNKYIEFICFESESCFYIKTIHDIFMSFNWGLVSGHDYLLLTGIRSAGSAYTETPFTGTNAYLDAYCIFKHDQCTSEQHIFGIAGSIGSGGTYGNLSFRGTSLSYPNTPTSNWLGGDRNAPFSSLNPSYNKKLKVTLKGPYVTNIDANRFKVEDLSTGIIVKATDIDPESRSTSTTVKIPIFCRRVSTSSLSAVDNSVTIYELYIKDRYGKVLLKPAKLLRSISADFSLDGRSYAAGTIGFIDTVQNKFLGNHSSSGYFYEST